MLGFGLCGFLITGWMLQYKVIAPLDRLGRRMRDIAQGDGDLTARVEVHGHSELDEVGHWFNVFIECRGRMRPAVVAGCGPECAGRLFPCARQAGASQERKHKADRHSGVAACFRGC